MKRIALSIAAFTLSTSAFADISSVNPELQGWVVEDPGRDDPTGTREVPLPFGTEDEYGGTLFNLEWDKPSIKRSTAVSWFNKTPARSDSASAPGVGDSYGSILHSVGFDG